MKITGVTSMVVDIDNEVGNFATYCRLCRCQKSESLTPIFANTKEHGPLEEKICDVLQIKIQAEDKISTMVCNQCIDTVNNWLSFKQSCTGNQIELEQWSHNSEMPDMNIQIKEEPVDHDPVMVNGETPVTVKNEPVEEEYNDLPPPLTPQGNEDGEVEMVGENSGVLLNHPNDGEYNSRKCSVCDKLFSSSGNRRKHEKTIHGLHGGSVSESDVGLLSQDDRPSSIDSQSLAELPANQNKEPEGKKILFAAGLKLLQRSGTPHISLENLSKIELSYIDKCEAMAQMYESWECACHNVRHPNLKGLLSHLRSMHIWFPVFTCYNCMITFPDRSSSARHHIRCTRGNLETLLKLSNLRKRSEVKTRLYQNYKCTKCKFMYSFHEDFCTHVDEHHSDVGLPLRCRCDRVFTTLEDFKNHAYVSCLVEFYCDICFVTVNTLDNFQKHAAEVHDSSEGFILLQDDDYKQRRSLPGSATGVKRDTNSKESTSVENIIHGKREKRSSYYKQPIIDDDDSENKVINRTFKKKVTGTVCPVCDKEYSSNNNMLRHYRTHALETYNKHERTADSYDDSLYCCPDCAGMLNSVEWEQHKKMHPKKTCDECGKVFQFQTELDRHRSVHLNLKVYRDYKTQSYSLMSPNDEASIVVMCEICDTMFTSKEQLKQHQLTHESPAVLNSSVEVDQKPFKKFSCKPCNKTYSGYGGLWTHNRKKHPEHKFSQSQFPKQYMHKQMQEKEMQSESAIFQPIVEFAEMYPSNNTKKEDNDNDDSQSYYTCKRCFKVFSTKSNLRSHMRSHGINYTSPTNNSGHKDKFVKKVLCNISRSQFDTNFNLEQYKNEEHAETEAIMPSLFEDEADVKAPFVFTCDVCVQTFSSKLALKRHKEKHAQERRSLSNRSNTIYCKHCKISFANLEELQSHMEQEHMPFKYQPKMKAQQFPCTICRKVFSTPGARLAHQGWHKRNPPLTVDKDNSLAPLLKKVKLEPSEPGPLSYKCSTCKAAVPNDTALQIHILEKHRNVNAIALPAHCTMCNLDFANQEEYDQHKRIHTMVQSANTVNFTCTYCFAAFGRMENLTMHLEMYHKAKQSDRVFEKQSSFHIRLKVHEQPQSTYSVPKQPLFSCSICNLGFDLPQDLRAHTIEAHPF